jgi:antitoxin (DNA-binding transcriptional repressor) of toxin-antitoxin stability system
MEGLLGEEAHEPKRFGVRDLRNDTAAVLAEMERDGVVYITRNGVVVAKLTPHHIASDMRTPVQALVARLAAVAGVGTGWADEFSHEKQAEIADQDDTRWG